MRLSFNNNNNIKIEDVDYYEVCKPSTHNYISCTKLLDLLQMVMSKADDLTIDQYLGLGYTIYRGSLRNKSSQW
uniref:Uncharacterized protein n=1 Tax=Physcomitrium patens TaxID=3218 RepID=A0A2K1KZM1_PHYPA|nr:hypothetical protein PHYPA_001981 [Physcomitrium patens]